MKRKLALLLAVIMLLSSVAVLSSCGKKPTETFTPATSFKDVIYDGLDLGAVTLVKNAAGEAGKISTDVFAGDVNKDYRDTGVYTMNDYMAGMGEGLDWNPHTWETNDDSYILDMITMGFYSFVLNANKDGYSIVPEMAADYPVDVTADYVGKYGIAEGDSAKAWKIALNQNAVWNDAAKTKINADTYIYSMQQQLDQKMLNRRADSFYAGDFNIVNAKNYLYSGKINETENSAKVDTFVKGADGVYTLASGETLYVALKTPLSWLGGISLEAAKTEYADYLDVASLDALLAKLSGDATRVALDDETKDLLTKVITTNPAWGETAAEVMNYLVYDYQTPVTTWEDVGLFKLDDYTIVIVLTDPMEEPAFYMPYNLSSNWIVYQPLYESCKKYFDAEGKEVAADSPNVAKITTDYCKSLEKSIGYGPYDLSYYELDKKIEFKRNDSWYGYSDGKHHGQYQTDKIVCTVIKEHKTALLSFLAGDVDAIGLDSEDMEKYGSSEALVYTPESYTTKLTFNTNYEKLLALGNNAQILAVEEFREAFSLALDRTEFARAYTSAASAGYGLLNYMYCYDPFSGALYRDSEGAKKALVDLYDIKYGAGALYKDLDAAYAAISGYDLAAAKELMTAAYNKAVEAKIYDGKSEIKLDMRVYSTDEIYVKMFNYFDGQIKKACEGTPFEGKVSLTMTADADYYNTMYSGNTAIIFSTWGGAAMSPFTMLGQCYTDASDGSGNQMEIGYKTELINLTIKVNGETITASLKDWADWCNAQTIEAITGKLGKFADYDYNSRCELFAKLEYAYLSAFTTTPIYYRQSASLLSNKVNYAVDTYLQVIGFGGIQFTTYNYTDDQWAAVKANQQY